MRARSSRADARSAEGSPTPNCRRHAAPARASSRMVLSWSGDAASVSAAASAQQVRMVSSAASREPTGSWSTGASGIATPVWSPRSRARIWRTPSARTLAVLATRGAAVRAGAGRPGPVPSRTSAGCSIRCACRWRDGMGLSSGSPSARWWSRAGGRPAPSATPRTGASVPSAASTPRLEAGQLGLEQAHAPVQAACRADLDQAVPRRVAGHALIWCYHPRSLNIQRLNHLRTIRHSPARMAGNLIT